MNERDIERLWVQVGRLTRMQRKEVIWSLTAQTAASESVELPGAEHHPVVTSKGARAIGAWHIQIVNSYHGRFEGWMHRFHGLATFYLENCLRWFRALDRTPRSASQPAQLLNLAIGA